MYQTAFHELFSSGQCMKQSLQITVHERKLHLMFTTSADMLHISQRPQTTCPRHCRFKQICRPFAVHLYRVSHMAHLTTGGFKTAHNVSFVIINMFIYTHLVHCLLPPPQLAIIRFRTYFIPCPA
jgi:hypothetical protein